MTATQVAAISLLTLPEVAEMLRRTPAQVRWMLHQGTAPKSALIAGRRMFREQDVIDFITEAFDAEQ